MLVCAKRDVATIPLMEDQDIERRRQAFKAFMKQRRLKPAEWARDAGLPSANTIYNYRNGDSGSLSHKTLEALAKAAHVTINEMFGEGEPKEIPLAHTIRIVGEVQAGHWIEAIEWDTDGFEEIQVPIDKSLSKLAFGLRIRGTSMNLVYPEGTVLVCVKLWDYGGLLEHEDRVIVYRRRSDDIIEATCKELHILKGGKAELRPKSSDQRYQKPIDIPWPYTEPFQIPGDGESIEIYAVVMGAYIEHKRR